ncbi:MAG: hypothetical protein MPI95_00860 [Nitrosopumilus sp.]|nr:hypothetical protein [Nitrosopumilus sp.]MDA7941417.1 hypothetical protein [Nitrosopumilus sp.]MDA7942825.1 hypothetical protein [Nitrosopumilus sp.]MDA7945405.1 hypothetical protein [Nitrosopumilus sp.]MDA7952660.1 hypothetical protein [Nitrosopumilus sp.]
MGPYSSVILAAMAVGIPIAFLDPSTGALRDPPFYLLFWSSIAGISAIIIYGSYRGRQERRRENARRKRPRK